MLPLLEPFHLRWLEEPVIPDDIQGYAELKRFGRIPIAGGEHEHTLLRLPRTHRSSRGGLSSSTRTASVASRKRARSRAGRGAPDSGHPARRPDAQLSRRDGQLEFADGRVLPRPWTSVGNELFWHLQKASRRPRIGSLTWTKTSPARHHDGRTRAEEVQGDGVRGTTKDAKHTKSFAATG